MPGWAPSGVPEDFGLDGWFEDVRSDGTVLLVPRSETEHDHSELIGELSVGAPPLSDSGPVAPARERPKAQYRGRPMRRTSPGPGEYPVPVMFGEKWAPAFSMGACPERKNLPLGMTTWLPQSVANATPGAGAYDAGNVGAGRRTVNTRAFKWTHGVRPKTPEKKDKNEGSLQLHPNLDAARAVAPAFSLASRIERKDQSGSSAPLAEFRPARVTADSVDAHVRRQPAAWTMQGKPALLRYHPSDK